MIDKIPNDLYKNLEQAGINAKILGHSRNSCPIDRRTNANDYCMWLRGYNLRTNTFKFLFTF